MYCRTSSLLRLTFFTFLQPQTFGNFEQRTQIGYDGYGPRRGYHRGQHHRGRGYNYRNAGRGGYMPPR